MRLRLSAKTALELSADYTSSLSDDLTTKVKSVPLQASLLVFPVRSVVSPYLLGGLGWYTHSITNANAAATAANDQTRSIREMGYHGGVGAELRAGKHIALHADYRYTHIRFGGDDSSSAATGSSGPAVSTVLSLIPHLTSLQESLRMSHQGSMWNWGMTFFF